MVSGALHKMAYSINHWNFTCFLYRVLCLFDLEVFCLLCFLLGTEDFFKAARPGCMLNWSTYVKANSEKIN